MTPSPRHPDLDALLVHASWARDLARGLVADTTAADDLVQEAWVAALESPPRHAENLRGWLGTVIRNLARSRGRSHGRRAAREAQVALEDHQEAPSSEALASRIDTQRRLASAVLELDEPYRSTVILRFYEGLDATQIANRLGVAPQLDRDFDGDRAAWVALVLPLARPRLAPASTAAVATTTLQGLIALKLTTKTAAIAAVALLGITGVALVVDPLASDGESPDNTPAPVTFSPLEESAPRVAEASAMDVSREVVEAAPTELTTDQALVAATTTTFASMRLVDPDGLPVGGAEVWSPRFPSTDPGVTSDADGSVSIPLAELEQRETVYIRIDHPRFTKVSLNNVVEPGRVTEFGDVILQPAGSVEGRVLLADGRPASGAWVKAALNAFEG
ncbi:MAG: RNA polymerase sigma factor, partial [Planctomycetota bacterium]